MTDLVTRTRNEITDKLDAIAKMVGGGDSAEGQFLLEISAHFETCRNALTAAQAGTVGDIVPDHCTGSAFTFEPGILNVNKDGSGYIAIYEADFECEDDRCEGPDGPEGSVYWIARMPASEMLAMRNFLNGVSSRQPNDETALSDERLREILAEEYDFAGYPQWGIATRDKRGGFHPIVALAAMRRVREG